MEVDYPLGLISQEPQVRILPLQPIYEKRIDIIDKSPDGGMVDTLVLEASA